MNCYNDTFTLFSNMKIDWDFSKKMQKVQSPNQCLR